MKIIIQLTGNSYVKRAFWTVAKQLAIISNPKIDEACNWDVTNAKILLPSIKTKFPEAKMLKLRGSKIN